MGAVGGASYVRDRDDRRDTRTLHPTLPRHLRRARLDRLWTFYSADCCFPVLERFNIEPSWERYKIFMTTFIDAFPDVHHTIEKLVSDGDSIWALYTMTGTHHGPLRGVQPSGRQVHYPIVAMYRVADGLITEADFVSDDLSMMRQIGGLPE